MCGINLILSKTVHRDTNFIKKVKELNEKYNKLRGPDNTYFDVNEDGIFIFNRLSINDISEKGNQPFFTYDQTGKKQLMLMCNGQIYNHRMLREKYELKCESESDCEVILRLYEKLGSFPQVVHLLDGVFAIVIYNFEKGNGFLARDRIGIRPLYFGYTERGELCISSIPQPLTFYCETIKEYEPSIISTFNFKKMFRVGQLVYDIQNLYQMSFEEKIEKLQTLLVESVKKRLISDRPIGALLSGGLDSSIVVSILCRLIGSENVRTYSIGLIGSTDLVYAKQVATHLNTKHTEVIITEEEMLKTIPTVIELLGSYDITTIRASTPMYLLCKYISEHTTDKVIFSGEGSDELFGGYLYFHKAPTDHDIEQETFRLVRNLHLYDVLRADRCVSSCGLEARVPFLDKDVVNFTLSLDGADRHPSYPIRLGLPRIEKYILRCAFSDYLPYSVAFRSKVAFSDGVSSTKKSWYEIIADYSETKISDEIFNDNFPSKESFYYYLIFKKLFKKYNPYIKYWLPKWCGDITNPSARILNLSVEE